MVFGHYFAGVAGIIAGIALAIVAGIFSARFFGIVPRIPAAATRIFFVAAFVALFAAVVTHVNTWRHDERKEGLQFPWIDQRDVAQEFRLKSGQRTDTVLTGPGRVFQMCVDEAYVVISKQPDGTEVEYNRPKGCSGMRGTPPVGMLTVRAEKDTLLRIRAEKE